MTGPATDADSPPGPGDDAPRPWWVGHPVVKYPGIGLVWGTIIAEWQLEQRSATSACTPSQSGVYSAGASMAGMSALQSPVAPSG